MFLQVLYRSSSLNNGTTKWLELYTYIITIRDIRMKKISNFSRSIQHRKIIATIRRLLHRQLMTLWNFYTLRVDLATTTCTSLFLKSRVSIALMRYCLLQHQHRHHNHENIQVRERERERDGLIVNSDINRCHRFAPLYSLLLHFTLVVSRAAELSPR